jgi:hypothetical protein
VTRRQAAKAAGYLDRKETHVSQYVPFFVIGIFGVLLFVGTIVWTECLFPEHKKGKD